MPTREEYRAAVEHNHQLFQRSETNAKNSGILRPVEDTAKFGYVLMSEFEDSAEVTNMRKTIAQNLPSDTTLVILADTRDAPAVAAEYAKWIPKARLIIATDADTSNGFWARDSFPYPVYLTGGAAGLISVPYYREFDSAKVVATAVAAPMTTDNFIFVGGNLLADDSGNCFSVDSYRLFDATSDKIKGTYHCKTHTLLPHVSGLGDVDEVLKPLPGKRMLTNAVEYKKTLEAMGYTVILLPATAGYRTYVNSLLVGNVAFVPAYGTADDAAAEKTYSDLGYKVFLIKSNDLSDFEHGSIHCQTMAYPKMAAAKLLAALHVKRLR